MENESQDMNLTTLDAPPTPWEEDDFFADTIEEPGEEPVVIAQRAIEEEMERLKVGELEVAVVEKQEAKEWNEKDAGQYFAIVPMKVRVIYPPKPKNYNRKKKGPWKPTPMVMHHLPTPDMAHAMWAQGRETAKDLAFHEAQKVLDMPPAVRAEYIAYNVCGPFDKAGPEELELACNENPALHRVAYRISTRVYKKGTKQMHIAEVKPLPTGAKSSLDDFAQRFPGGVIPYGAIMQKAAQLGVSSVMEPVMSRLEEMQQAAVE